MKFDLNIVIARVLSQTLGVYCFPELHALVIGYRKHLRIGDLYDLVDSRLMLLHRPQRLYFDLLVVPQRQISINEGIVLLEKREAVLFI